MALIHSSAKRFTFPSSTIFIFISSLLEYRSSKTGIFHAMTEIPKNNASATAIPKPSLDDGKINTLALE